MSHLELGLLFWNCDEEPHPAAIGVPKDPKETL
jgi:hypothetical protein